MKTQVKFTIFIAIVIVLIGGFGLYSALKPTPPSKLDGFAQCLKTAGAEFYGAFWCTHCQEQKEDFGTSAKYLPYIECSKSNNSQMQVCIDNKIESYPTWRFKDGTSQTGRLSLQVLAEKTQCVLPQ